MHFLVIIIMYTNKQNIQNNQQTCEQTERTYAKCQVSHFGVCFRDVGQCTEGRSEDQCVIGVVSQGPYHQVHATLPNWALARIT